MVCWPRDRSKAQRKPGGGPRGESRPFQFGLGELLAWVALLSVWWGVCRCLEMNVFGLLLTTAWLFTVAVVRTTVGELAALAVSVVLALIAEVLVVFVPAVTTKYAYTGGVSSALGSVG